MTRTLRCTPAFVPVLLAACVSSPGILGAIDEGAGDGEGDGGTSAGVSMTGNQETGESTDDDGASTTGPTIDECPIPDTWGVRGAPSFTPAQWDGVVADLIGVDASFGRRAHAVLKVAQFDLGIAESSAQEAVADWATQAAELADLDVLLSCDADAVDPEDEAACWDAFVPALAARAWRREPSAAELDALAAVDGTFAERIRAAIAAILASENMWRITPSGTPDGSGAIALDADSLALHLALFLWHSLPDDALLGVAADDSLLDPDVFDAQVDRLLADPRAERMVADFHTQWLEIDHEMIGKDEVLFPDFSPDQWAAMRRETTTFAVDVVLHGDARFDTLLSAPHTFVNAELVSIYGDAIQGAAPSTSVFERVDLDPAQRGGVLTQPAWLTAHARDAIVGFVLRGKWVREAALCIAVPPPPPGIDPALPGDAPTDQGHKALHDALVSGPECAGCHLLMDPFSFGFDNYDAVGSWTDVLWGAAVDPSGSPGDLPDYGDRDELLELLAYDDGVAACVPKQWARFALGREIGAADSCLQESLLATFVETDGDLRAVIGAIARSDAFRHLRLE